MKTVFQNLLKNNEMHRKSNFISKGLVLKKRTKFET